MSQFRCLHPVRVLSALTAALGLVALVQSWSWWDAPFPGFFLMPNRVVPSAGLPGWAGATDGRPVFQQILLAVDESSVWTASEGYERATRHRPGETVSYLFSHAGALETRELPIRRLAPREYLGVFGAYFLTGLAYLILAVVAGERWEGNERARALTTFGWAGAAFSFTGMDLYGPGIFFPLHAAAEVFLLAASAHLALVWPRSLWPRFPDLGHLIYGLGAMFALVYQLFLFEPRAYTVLHNLSQGLIAVPTLVLAARLAVAAGRSAPDEARALRRLLNGALVGFVGPGVVLGVSGLAGGAFPVSAAAWLNFVFPLACVSGLRALERTPEVCRPAA